MKNSTTIKTKPFFSSFFYSTFFNVKNQAFFH